MSQSMTAMMHSQLPDTDDVSLNRLLHPGRFYERPGDVLADASISVSEKRAILSSWASDACAVDSCPPLRHPPFAASPVTFDEVMEALASLDRAGPGIGLLAVAGAGDRSGACDAGRQA